MATAPLPRSRAPTPAEPESVDRMVGERLHLLRKTAGVSLETLARGSDRSVGYISQIERGLSSPTVRDVAAFARTLGVPFVELLADPAPSNVEQFVRRDSDRTHLPFHGTGIVKRVLAPRNAGAIQFYVMEIDAGGTTGAAPYSHDGEEAGFVLKGRIRLRIGEAEHRLSRGDSFRFQSRVPHAFHNDGTGPAEVLWINVADRADRGG